MGKYHGNRDVKKEHYNLGVLLNEEKKKEILKDAFKKRVGYELSFENPQTMNEKIMWLKLYYQDPLITKCCDKYAVKDYVAETIGKEYVVPTIAKYNNPDEVDFDKLPNQFVLKVNWSSGYNIIVSDKSKVDQNAIKKQLKKWMKADRNAYYQYFNWGYKHMQPVVYAEKYLEQIDGQVYDYKFFICNGKFEFMLIATDRNNDETLTHDFFDNNFNYLNLTYGNLKHAKILPSKPKNFDKMVDLAEKLAKPFPFVRVDFYEIGSKIYLGEMTFYPAGGLKPFIPNEWDYKLGEKIKLPEKKIIDKETSVNKLQILTIKSRIYMRNKLKKIRRKIIRKEYHGKNKYIKFCGLRIPYETHIESTKNGSKKYIRLLGIEFCYKNLPEAAVVITEEFKYRPNTPLEAFLMEDKITYDIKKIHCEQKAYKQMGYFPNLKEPKSFNEKIIWLALNYKNPNIAIAADKAKAKQWISERIGSEYVIPLIGVYYDVNDINFKELPQRFVAKLNDGWGADNVMVVIDKNKLNIDKTKAILSSWLYPWKNYYYQNMCITDEKMEKPTIIIEEYVEQKGSESLDDFKFYCCNGEPKFALVVTGRGTSSQTRSFVDMNWNILPVERAGKPSCNIPQKPQCFDKMLELCRILSKEFPLVRVDCYEVDGRVYIGEMTFTPGMFLKFKPKEWDFRLGEFLDLSKYMGDK